MTLFFPRLLRLFNWYDVDREKTIMTMQVNGDNAIHYERYHSAITCLKKISNSIKACDMWWMNRIYIFCFTQRRWVKRDRMKLVLMMRIFRCNLFRFSPFSQSLSAVHWLSMLHSMNIGNYGNQLTTNNTPVPKNKLGMRYNFHFDIWFLIEICNYSRGIWESNLDLVHKHNLQADLGAHSYWLGMNKFADMVNNYFLPFDHTLFFVYWK